MIREQPPCPLSVSLYRVSRPFGPRIIISRKGNLGANSIHSCVVYVMFTVIECQPIRMSALMCQLCQLY